MESIDPKYCVIVHFPTFESDNGDFEVFDSNTPFMAFNKGDLIDPAMIRKFGNFEKYWKITDIVHELGQFGKTAKHQIRLFTEVAD